MELNAEQIKKALECCSKEWHCGFCGFTEKECALIKQNTLALITSQEQRIKELTEENEYLKSTDIGELQQEYDSLAKSLEDAIELIDKLRAKKAKLTEERDTFREATYKLQNYIQCTFEKQSEGYELTAAKAVAEMEMWRVVALEKKKLTEENERLYQSCTNLERDTRADTVRKMQERLHKRFRSDRDAIYTGYNIHRYIDQIGKERLEGDG